MKNQRLQTFNTAEQYKKVICITPMVTYLALSSH